MAKKSKFYGNIETKVAHAQKAGDACRMNELKRGNVVKSESIEELDELGFKRCQICFPTQRESETPTGEDSD